MHSITDLDKSLSFYRQKRDFSPDFYVKTKVELLNRYFDSHDITCCVLGISGGIDSAVSLGLLNAAMKKPGSSIQKVVPVLLPLNHGCGVTKQDAAVRDGRLLIEHLGLMPCFVDLSQAHQILQDAIVEALEIQPSLWAAGQLASNIRTPALYHIATLLTQEGLKSIVCGTTNRDEGGYLGFFGKASDGMVDVQIISDLHKSEVYQVAKFLALPEQIIQRVPTGDTFDGKSDEESLECTYDFIELYTAYLNCNIEREKWAQCPEFHQLAERLERRHQINSHKYMAGSQALHFDVYDRAVEGGWRENK